MKYNFYIISNSTCNICRKSAGYKSPTWEKLLVTNRLPAVLKMPHDWLTTRSNWKWWMPNWQWDLSQNGACHFPSENQITAEVTQCFHECPKVVRVFKIHCIACFQWFLKVWLQQLLLRKETRIHHFEYIKFSLIT